MPLNLLYSFISGQVRAEQLLVVSDVNTLISKGGMGPADAAALVKLSGSWVNKFGPADFVKSFRREFADNKLTALVKHPYFVCILDQVNVCPPSFRDRGKIFPNPVARMQVQASKFAVTINAVNEICLDNRRGYAAMQAVGVSFAGALTLPEFFYC